MTTYNKVTKKQKDVSKVKTIPAAQMPDRTSDLNSFDTLQRAIENPSKETLTPPVMLQLQRTIGNQAVQRLLKTNKDSGAIQRHPPIDPDVDVRSPFAETLFNQASVIQSAIEGRPLTGDEMSLAQPIFGNSLDFSRVRIIERDLLAGTTVGNNIRLPEGFDVSNTEDAQLLIHELTHVWQYQHNGTSYISEALHTQIIGHIETGNRNAAYDYVPDASKTFFDFTPEQQAFIIENYHTMQRDTALIAEGNQTRFKSNHLAEDGFRADMTAAERQAEIDAEMPIHETYLQQMQQALPQPEIDLMLDSTRDLMTMPNQDLMPEELRPVPLNPLIELRFPGL